MTSTHNNSLSSFVVLGVGVNRRADPKKLAMGPPMVADDGLVRCQSVAAINTEPHRDSFSLERRDHFRGGRSPSGAG